MRSVERLRAALNGEPVDHVPFSPNLAYVFESLPPDIQKLGHMGFCREIGADLLNRFGPCPVSRTLPSEVIERSQTIGEREVWETVTPVGTLRRAYARSGEGNTLFLVEHPLKCEEDYKIQMWIEDHARYALADGMAATPHANPNPDELTIGMLIPNGCKTAFQFMVEHLVGTEELMYALADFPDTVESLWRTMVARNQESVALATDSWLDYFLTWEDSSTQNYSPAMYQRYIAPEITAWCDQLGRHDKRYIQHACGHVRQLLPTMKTQGILAVESLSPAPTGNLTLREARALLGSTVGIIGGIEPVEFLRLSLDKLGPYVEEVIADGRGGPFILANSDSCPPGVTVEKFRLVAEIARRHT